MEPALHERITAAADGNPLFVQELLAMLVDDAGRPVGDVRAAADDPGAAGGTPRPARSAATAT